MAWADLRARLGVPADFPAELIPPDGEAEVALTVDVQRDAATAGRPGRDWPTDIAHARAVLTCTVAVELEVAPSLWGFALDRRFTFEFLAGFDDEDQVAAEDRLDDALRGGATLTGVARVTARLKVPQPPALPGLRLAIGGRDGFVTVRLLARVGAGTGGGQTRFEIELLDLGEFAVDLPGLIPGVTASGPPLVEGRVARLFNAVEVAVPAGGSPRVSGKLAIEGGFTLRTPTRLDGPPLLEYVEPWLCGLELRGALKGSVAIGGDPAAGTDPPPLVELDLDLTGAGVRANLLDVLRRLTVGLSAPDGASGGTADAAARAELGFDLDKLELRLGRTGPERAWSLAGQFWFKLVLPGLTDPIKLYLALSDRELSVGLADQPIPLWLPHIHASEFWRAAPSDPPRIADVFHDAIPAGAPGPPTRPPGLAPGLDGRGTYRAIVDGLLAALEALTGAAAAGAAAAPFDAFTAVPEDGGGWRIEPGPRLAGAAAAGFRVAAGRVDGGHELALAAQLGERWTALWVRPTLHLEDFSLHVSLRNPRDVRVKGTVRLGEFAGPLALLGQQKLTIGVAADLIYFAAESTPPSTIEIPALLRGYEGGSLTFGQLLIGFGYPKRSLALAFAGGIELPERVIDDLDLSDQLGAGVRLPQRTQVRARFDLIPIVIGKVFIPVPMAQFDFDFRRQVSPPLADEDRCTPAWDGLQLVVPGVVRMSLKHISYSPLLGMIACSNSDFDGDLEIGGERHGVAIVADEVFWAYGVDNQYSAAMAPVNGHPFVDNLCVDLRLGGFRLHANLQRPIPTFSPLAIFELVALLSAPLDYTVAPGGELARSMRVSLRGVRLVLPEPVRRLVPGVAAVLERPTELTIDVATYVGLLQRIGRVVAPVVAAGFAAVEAGGDARAVVTRIKERALALRPDELAAELLALLPPAARKVRVALDLGGFSGGAVLVLAGDDELRADLARGRRELLVGRELEVFDADDLDALDPPAAGARLGADDLRPALARLLVDPPPPAARLAAHLRASMTPRGRALLTELGRQPWTPARAAALAGELEHALAAGPLIEVPAAADLGLSAAVRERAVRLATPDAELPEREVTRRARSDRIILATAFPDGLVAPRGLLVGAHLRIAGAGRARFLGRITDDGSFNLVSRAALTSLPLRIAGLDVPLPLAIRGRLTIAGRARRNGVRATVTGAGHARWDVLPGLLHVTLGTDGQEATVTVHGDGRFVVDGPAELAMFSPPAPAPAAPFARVRATGTLTVTETLARGDQLRITVMAQLGPLVIHNEVHGRAWLGPGPRFGISGDGVVRLWGAEADARLDIDERGLALTAHLNGDVPDLLGIAADADLTVAGRIELADLTAPPRYHLRGDGTVTLWPDAAAWRCLLITGSVEVDGPSQPRVAVRGKLRWLDRDWLDGSIEIGDDQVVVGGHARFQVDLPSLPSPHNSVTLRVMLDAGGSITVDGAGRLRSASLDCRWIVSAVFGQQAFPILVAEQHDVGFTGLRNQPLCVEGLQPVPAGLKLPNVSHGRSLEAQTDNGMLHLRLDGSEFFKVASLIRVDDKITVHEIIIENPPALLERLKLRLAWDDDKGLGVLVPDLADDFVAFSAPPTGP